MLRPAQAYNRCALLLPSALYGSYIKEENPSKALLIDVSGHKKIKVFLKRAMHFNLLSSKIKFPFLALVSIISMNNVIHFQNHPKYRTHLI